MFNWKLTIKYYKLIVDTTWVWGVEVPIRLPFTKHVKCTVHYPFRRQNHLGSMHALILLKLKFMHLSLSYTNIAHHICILVPYISTTKKGARPASCPRTAINIRT